MSFVDALIDTNHDCDVVMVDRRHVPGGHWNNTYPFVQLHQAAACYGVNSQPLGTDHLDNLGLNAGLYERSHGVQICDYFRRVLDEHHLASGQVRFFPMSNYLGLETQDLAFIAALTGVTTEVKVRRVCRRRSLSRTDDPITTHAVVRDRRRRPMRFRERAAQRRGACDRLHDHRRRQDRLRRVHLAPRERCRPGPHPMGAGPRRVDMEPAFLQPLELVTDTIDGVSRCVEASAEAGSIDDLFARLEASDQLLRLDEQVTPTMYHGATVTIAELKLLRTIENVVRLGHVKTIGPDQIVLERGTIPTDRGQLHVDCSAAGLGKAPARPIFAPDRITLQCIATVFPTFNAAVIGYLEASRGDDEVAKSRPRPRIAIRKPPRTGSRTCAASWNRSSSGTPNPT